MPNSPFIAPNAASRPARRSACQSACNRRGFTLIELAVTTAISTLLMTTAAPGLRDLLDRQRLQGVAAQLAADVRFVRADAVARNEALRLSFHSATWGTCYVLHTGLRDQCQCNATGPAACNPGSKQLKTVALSAESRVAVRANVASILFDPLHGTGTPSGSLDVVSSSGQAIRHVVNVMGRVRTCSPAGSAPAAAGLPVC